MKRFTANDISSLRARLVAKIPELAGKELDFFYAPETERAKECAIVTFVGKHGIVGVRDEWDKFPSETLLAKIRLLL